MLPTLDELHNWYPDLSQGAIVSVKLAVAAIALGILVGLICALGLRSRFGPLRWCIKTYIEVFRGTPALVQIFLVYFGLPDIGFLISAFWAGVVALGLNAGAYLAEVFRAGINSVPRGQREASLAIGMLPSQAMRYVILPQALRTVVPPTISTGIAVFQATALTLTIAVPEIMNNAYALGNETFRYLPIFVVSAAFYAVISLPLSVLAGRLERKV